ncbi:MAG: hypothetical protein AAGD88_17215 [Bacteroidota bacterium]
MKKSIPYVILSMIILLTSCSAVDLRPDQLRSGNISNAEQRGREFLTECKLAMGYDKLENMDVYETTTTYIWNPGWLLMPMNPFPGNNGKDVQLRFATNSFDGQIEYLEGRKKGDIVGLQSWKGYKIKKDKNNLKLHEHDRYLWGLATFHYLVEAPVHLPQAEIVRFAGQKEFNGINYDLVYVTWGSEEPNKDYDRFLVYVNPKTKFIDLIEATINDYFLPMPKGMQHATVQYDRSETSIGAHLPTRSVIQLKSPKKRKRYVYYYEMRDYRFDSFDRDELYPIDDVPYFGLSKTTEKE